MKKHVSILLGLLVIFSSLFVSCDENELDSNICKITVKSEGNGTVSITDYIGTSVNVLIGNRVEVVATPDDGWAFIGWYISGTESPVSTDASFTFITSENVTLTARFAKLSDIIIRSGGNGSVAFKDYPGISIAVLPGTEVTVIATPNENCDFVGWFTNESDTSICVESEYTFRAKNTIELIAKFCNGANDNSNANNTYSSYHANIIFDGTIYPYNQARSFGQFICIRQGANIGEYKLTDALGNTQTVNIPQKHLQQGKFYYGLGGLIIGTPILSDGTLWAYDWACPSCELARYRVEIDYTTGHATCPRCATKFDLNSYGIAIEGKSRPLWRYRVYDNGAEVRIQN